MPVPARPVSLPDKITVNVGDLVRLEATATGEVAWDVPEELAVEADYEVIGKRLILPSRRPGQYAIRAWVCHEGKPIKSNRCVVVIIGPTPVPPGPGPGPIPPVPGPTFADQVAIAFTRDVTSGKGTADARQKARDVYRAALLFLADHATLGSLYAVMRSTNDRMLGQSLPETRKVIGTFLNETLPRDPNAKMTPDLQGLITSTFTRIADALDKAKP
jgi:hypothetical protein